MLSLDDLVTLALRIKERAAEHIGEDREYDYSSAGGDTARAVDEAAQEELKRWIRERESHPDVLSEESGLIKGEETGVLLIDPVDGSSNADRGIPFACVSIAYASSYSLKDLELAVVLDIFRGDLYHSIRNEGAFKNGTRIKVREFRGTPMIYAPCQPNDPVSEERLGFEHIARRDLGSVALGLAYVASGRVDALIDLRGVLRAVDLAAGLLLVKEAGGLVYVSHTEVRGLKRELSVMAGVKEVLNRVPIPPMMRL